MFDILNYLTNLVK